jgi:hypothetical protein
VLFGTRFTDLCYGYNAFWRRLLPSLDLPDIDTAAPADGRKLWGDGFEIETLINVRIAAQDLRIQEVSSHEAPRLYGESNLRTFRDGARVLRTVLAEFRRRRRRARYGAYEVAPVAVGLDRQIEELRSLNRHRIPAPGGYATVSAATALTAALTLPEASARFEEA